MEKLKKQNLKYTNKGITLIALVITIIVMLILVAVTISMAVNGGLFDYAGRAATQTNEAIVNEQELANLQLNMTVDELIDKYTTEEKGGITASIIQRDLASYIGEKVNYEVDAYSGENSFWEIFYADNKHIYLITNNQVYHGITSGNGGTADLTLENLQNKYPAVASGLLNKTYDPKSVGSELKYTSTNDNMQSTLYLLDSTIWASYAQNDYAKWAIGTPTLELFVNVFNVLYPDKTVTLLPPSNYGYINPFFAEDSIPEGTVLRPYEWADYAFACPAESKVSGIYFFKKFSGCIKSDDYYNCNFHGGVRPIVCLDEDVQITWDSTEMEYTLSKK